MSTPQNRFLQAIETQEAPEKRNRFLEPPVEPTPTPAGITFEERPRDVGFLPAFGSGVKEGFLMPLNIFGREGVELNLDETHEKVANILGEFVGLGIGFIPFSVGTGVLLKGVGLASRVSPPVADFLKFSIAGTVQAAGTAETPEEVPKQAAIGLAAGVAIDGFFLSRAIKARARDAARAADELVSPGQLAKEVEISPAGSKSPERLTTEVQALANDDLSLEQAILKLSEEHVETVVFPGLKSVDEIVSSAKASLPEAQVLSRKVVGEEISEVLVHNPADPTSRLTTSQISQWETTGAFEGMGLTYRQRPYVATGKPVAPGHVQIRSMDGRVTFAPLKTDVSNFLSPRVLTPARRLTFDMKSVVREGSEVGFTIAARGARGQSAVRRGVVDASEYRVVESFDDFVNANLREISQIEAPSIREAAQAYALRIGLKGLREVDNGVTKRVHVFDQQSIKFVNEPPRVGINVDQSVTKLTPDGQVLLESFVPGWENAVTGPLRRAGFAEKDIRTFIEQYTSDEFTRMQGVMSKDLQALARANELRFFGGCV